MLNEFNDDIVVHIAKVSRVEFVNETENAQQFLLDQLFFGNKDVNFWIDLEIDDIVYLSYVTEDETMYIKVDFDWCK
jgi:hypothetical protein